MAKRTKNQNAGEDNAPHTEPEFSGAVPTPPEDDSYQPFSVRHPWVRYLRYLWLLVLIPIGYLCIQVAFILAPTVNTATAVDHTMTDYSDVRGVVAMNSTPITRANPETGEARESGVIYYTVRPGQWVSAESVVAELYPTQAAAEARAEMAAIDLELEQLQTAQRTTSEGVDANIYMQQMLSGIHTLRSVTDSLDYSGLGAAMAEVAQAQNKYQIATGQAENFQARIDVLVSRRAALEAQAVPTGTITMPATGFFVPAAKYDRTPHLHEDLAATSPEELAALLAAPQTEAGAGIVGYAVSEYKWYFFMTVDAEDVVKYTAGRSLYLSFPEAGGTSLPAKVESVEQDEGMSTFKVTISSEQVTAELLRLRVEDARVVFRIETGLRINRDALRIIDGQTGVYIKFGNNAYFRRIQILLEDENYILIPSSYTRGVNEVQRFDEVIVDTGGMELYDGKIL